jgi:16S rRNA processing protein RimM
MGSQPQFLTIARILTPWGIRGEVKIQSLTDIPQLLSAQSRVYLDAQPLLIECSRFSSVKPQDKPEAGHLKGHLIVKFATIDDRNAAEKLRGRELEIPRSQAPPLAQGEYYPFQLMGLEVKTTEGEPLGEIVDVWLRESNDVYVVRGSRGEVLIPAIEDVVKEIDLEQGVMLIEAIDRLLD